MSDDTDTAARRLRRLRWGVRIVLALGLLASIAANVLHAEPNPVSQVIAAWSPLALLLTVELISRVPVHRPVLAVVRLTAAAVIALIAAYVSYFHLAAVASRYGEHGVAAFLLPISVDGLVVVASVSLVELSGRLHATTAPPVPTSTARTAPSGPVASPQVASPAPTAEQDHAASSALPAGQPPDDTPDPAADTSEELPNRSGRNSPAAPAQAESATPPAAGPTDEPSAADHPPPGATGHESPPSSDTARVVAYWRQRDPELTAAAIARKIGKSERTVRRNWLNDQHAPTADLAAGG